MTALPVLWIFDMQFIPRALVSQDWITLTLVIILLIMVLIKLKYPENYLYFSRILVSDKYFRESKKAIRLFGPFGYWLFFAQTLTVSLGLYFLVVSAGYKGETSYVLFLKIFLIYGVFVVGKYLIEKMLGVLFSIEEFLDQYVFYKLTYKNFLGLCLIPILLFVGYIGEASFVFYRNLFFLFIAINLVFLAIFYQKNQRQVIGSLFYFILYLCAFEIAPYFILYKVIR